MGPESISGIKANPRRTFSLQATNSWERLPPIPAPGAVPRSARSAIYAISGSNVAGGGGPHEGVNVNEVYDLR